MVFKYREKDMKSCSLINKSCRFIVLSFLLFAVSLPAYSQTGDSSDSNIDLCEMNACPEGQECIEDFFDFCPTKGQACVLCEYCGNGYKSDTETCDDGNANDEDGCRACQTPFCGDGISNDFDSNETCDDGNDVDTDSCRDDCTYCGDGVKDATEDCDDGNDDNIDGCRDDCTIQMCGDLIVDSNETCDDGNGIDDDACRNNCTFCGDDIIDSAEECDGDNFGESGKPEEDAICNSSCGVEYCGDGVTQDYEVCDPTDLSDIEEAAACTNKCVQMECPGEGYDLVCDFSCEDKDGNATFCCGCPSCGDGEINGLEECDDANEDDLDGCRKDCTIQMCGDGIVDEDEECDDGNNIDGDGCDSTCKSEIDSCGRSSGEANYGNSDCCAGSDRPGKHGDVLTYKGGSKTVTTVHKLYRTTKTVSGSIDYHVYICLPKSSYSDGSAAKHSDARRTYESLRGKGLKSRWRSPGTWDVDTRFFSKHNTACWTCAPVRLGGCFVPETMIKLADGTEKAIEDLKAGDVVYNPVTKVNVAIKSILESAESDPIVSVVTQDGSIEVTQSHPMVTDRGIVKASELYVGDRVLTESGEYFEVQNISELPVSYSQRVLNIILDSDSEDSNDHMVLADGIVTGDLIVQRQLAEESIK